MRIVKALAILFGGPTLGLLIAFFLGVIALPQDPNYAANGGHVAPGDGILPLLFIFVSVIISVPTSIFFAVRVLKKSHSQDLSEDRVGQ